MTRQDFSELAALVGIDWADRAHSFVLQEVGSSERERGQVEQTPEAMAEFMTGLRARFEGRPVGFCLETSRGPVAYALLEYDFTRLYPVNPKALKRFREAFATSGAKDDPKDADLLLEMLRKHPDRLRLWKPADTETRKLARLTEDRREAVDLRTRLSQELRAELKGYFPQALEWTGSDLYSQLATDFLLRWGTLEAVQREDPGTLRKFYYGHNCRRGDLIKKRLEEIRAARPLTTDRAIIETSVLKVQLLVRQLQALAPSIARYDELIEQLFAAHADADLFSGLPGSGPALGPRLLVAFGTDRQRYEDAQEIQEYSGIAPVTERSGKSLRVHWRWSAPTFLRQTFHEHARLSIQRSEWARAYYELKREKGQDHHAAIRALAFKWIRILYRCWKDRTPYDEARYIRSLHERGSPLAKRLALPAAA
jgi:transposase